MKKITLTITLLLFTSACGETTTQNTAETGEDTIPTTWEEVEGYVIDKGKEGGNEKFLLVEGITQQEALEKTSREILSGDSYDNAIWLTDEDIDFPDLGKGEAVIAWWDRAKPHQEPGILTVPAEKVEMNHKEE
ncbi:DUF3221 domain-containing protein [Planococcus salinus]|uniref:DUF3221 domain-containing protein n=1 Tax=Planococcus salinus TaxID=1848460 RepID=A0A3M8PBX9_9BACL|nr:DUF3221 domain-containing protein [Planococcus salinus]RNF41226.1 hypothetical protein EEX84_02450 [Planococcus salinus]